MTGEDERELMARQLADLTRAVDQMSDLLTALGERADVQQERIDLAARELGEVSARLQAAADALRQAI